MNTKRTITGTCVFSALTLVSMQISILHAGEIAIEQSGQRGNTVLEVSPQAGRYDVVLRQSGTENKLDIGVKNTVDALIHQHGSFGLIDLDLNGRNDVVRVDQAGFNSSLIGSLSGHSNSTQVDQNGRDNNILIDLSGRSNQLSMNQGGSNNMLSITHSTNNSILNLNQSGSNNHMSVDHSSSHLGLDISQEGHSGSIMVTD